MLDKTYRLAQFIAIILHDRLIVYTYSSIFFYFFFFFFKLTNFTFRNFFTIPQGNNIFFD